MTLTNDRLNHDLEMLRHGGEEAVRLFFDMARRFYETGGNEYLQNWIDAAAPMLPEAERHAALALLLRSFFGEDAKFTEKHGEYPTLQ